LVKVVAILLVIKPRTCSYTRALRFLIPSDEIAVGSYPLLACGGRLRNLLADCCA